MSGEMRVAVETSRSVSHKLFGLFLVAIRAVAARPELFFAKETLATADCEGNNDAITPLEFGDGGSDFHNFPHRFMQVPAKVAKRRKNRIDQSGRIRREDEKLLFRDCRSCRVDRSEAGHASDLYL